MNIKLMLARLQTAIGRDNLIDQMVLIPEAKTRLSKKVESAPIVNLIVGYNTSPKSQTALDIALCVAHQTRLATKMEVTVQAVYVIEDNQNIEYSNFFSSEIHPPLSLECPINDVSQSVTSVLTQPTQRTNAILKKADQVLWQARSLAEEWQGSFKAHLRFGCINAELKKVVELEAADVLFLGCTSVKDPIIQSLDSNFPCTVLGIPNCIDE